MRCVTQRPRFPRVLAWAGHVAWLRAGLLLLVVCIAWGCVRETPVTGRKQVLLMPESQEVSLGVAAFQDVLKNEQLSTNPDYIEMVNRVGKRLATATGEQYDWEFKVIASDVQNAFCLPGGKVAVYTGILPITANSNGLAAVMGHEIAHAIARHGAERMATQKLVQMGSMAAGMSVGEMDPQTQRAVMGAIGAGAQYGILLPFSRDHESEADKIGLLVSARACFDPREAPRLWERMGQASSGRQPSEFMSTHPSHGTRIRQLEEWMPEAMAIYQQHCGRG